MCVGGGSDKERSIETTNRYEWEVRRVITSGVALKGAAAWTT